MTHLAKIEQTEIEAPASASASMVAMIERVALDPSVPIERLERLMDMQDRALAKQDKAVHAASLADALGEMPNIPMSGRGNNNKAYSTLKDITSVTRPVLAKHGLSLTFDAEHRDGKIITIAILAHRNGYEKRVAVPLPADKSGSKNDVQAIGSSQTYGQRYAAQAILGLSLGEDTEDDGRASASSGTITEGQWRELQGLIETAGVAEQVVLDAARIDALEMLPLSGFASVKARLVKRIEANKAGR